MARQGLPGHVDLAACVEPAPSSTTRAEALAGRASAASAAVRRARLMTGSRTPRRPASFAPSLVPIRDPAAIEVVRRQLDLDPVTGQDADVVTPHLARDVTQDIVPVVQLHLEHRVWEGLDDLALHLDLLFLGHVVRRPQMRRTFTAFGPLSPLSSSYSTFAFSASDLKPPPSMPE